MCEQLRRACLHQGPGRPSSESLTDVCVETAGWGPRAGAPWCTGACAAGAPSRRGTDVGNKGRGKVKRQIQIYWKLILKYT